jgi:hypothetical protein
MQLGRALERRRRVGRSAGLAAPRAGCRACLDVCAGSFPTASRSGPPVSLRAGLLGTRAAIQYRVVPAPSAPRFVAGPLRMQVKDGCRTAG